MHMSHSMLSDSMLSSPAAREFQAWIAASQADVDVIAAKLEAAGLCDVARRGDRLRLKWLYDAYYDMVMSELRRLEASESS